MSPCPYHSTMASGMRLYGPRHECFTVYDQKPTPVERVHNHRPYRPVCNERLVDGQLRGACLSDDGSDR